MLRGFKGIGIIVLFLLAGFLFLATLRESCGQIEVLPGEPASPVEGGNTTKKDDFVDQETRKLELVLSRPLIFFVLPTFEEESYVFDSKQE
jgi:hypothetical protein